jgi:Na+-driven multidrug efflux pump
MVADARSARLNRPDDPPYSFANELRIFLLEGVPLFVFYILKQGVPPFFTMVVAGHTPDSATLQASLGFGRTFYNAVTWMPLKALTSYYENVVPVAIGARRDDRLPMYLRRSVLLVAIFIMPSMVLQMFADSILLTLGVPAVNAEGVGEYCRLMVATAWLTLLDNHLEILLMNNLKFVKMANFNSLLAGLGVECLGTYILVYRLDLGIRGCAYAQILARLVRVLLWLSLMLSYNLTRIHLVPPEHVHANDQLLTRKELRIFLQHGLPTYLTFLSGG